MAEEPAIRPDKKHALGLPEGSVRAIMALIVVAGAVALAILQFNATRQVPEWFISIVSMVSMFYYLKPKDRQ